jgi:hypothetical protein
MAVQKKLVLELQLFILKRAWVSNMEIQNHIHQSNAHSIAENCMGGMYCLLNRMIQEELSPLMELISEDILSNKCHINLGHILNIYRVTFVIGIFLNFNFNFNYKITSS